VMDEICLINIKEQIFAKNTNLANEIRERLQSEKVFLLNLMSSPGSGKTSLIVETIRRLRSKLRIGVIEGDIDSLVDSEKVAAEGVPAVQLRTGGACHLDAPMVNAALETMELPALDLVFIENIGNLVCPASFDTGAALKVMILSVPEGDDKILKYPLMFSVVDCLIINKMDYLSISNFNLRALHERMRSLNPKAQVFEISCQTGEGIDHWCKWLEAQADAERTNHIAGQNQETGLRS
jgi:hydrogenase nickel incorporation protein HypB